MDPYLEGSPWTTFHFALGTEIVRQLAPRLRPRYLVLPVERFLIETYDLALDYTQPPDVALEGKAALLADELLQAAGKRQA
jgi:hypothetical protein